MRSPTHCCQHRFSHFCIAIHTSKRIICKFNCAEILRLDALEEGRFVGGIETGIGRTDAAHAASEFRCLGQLRAKRQARELHECRSLLLHFVPSRMQQDTPSPWSAAFCRIFTFVHWEGGKSAGHRKGIRQLRQPGGDQGCVEQVLCNLTERD